LVFEEMRALAERVVNVELISAQPLNDKDQERFVTVLKKRMNCNIALECQVDKNILGGAIIRAGDLVIDGSIRGRLAKLGDAVGIS
jgi:F-type H+-transporting ATPase subunit delta